MLFLGEWCRLYGREKAWSALEGEVLPYHWDDRVQLSADYQYLQSLYEALLDELSTQLNQVHRVDFPSKYWRILIGPWLGNFVQVLFDRWRSLQEATEQFEISETILLQQNESSMVPLDMEDFMRYVVSDQWNHFIYGSIIQGHLNIPFRRIPFVGEQSRKTAPMAVSRKAKQLMAYFYSQIARHLSRRHDFFLYRTYLPVSDEFRLSLRLGQMPQFWRPTRTIPAEIDKGLRGRLFSNIQCGGFEKCVRELIPRQLPTAYLEGFSRLRRQIDTLPWPKEPMLIWTSVSFHTDDLFKAWAAQKAITSGTPLVIGQHGGHYGVGRWSFAEDHEIAICDKYLSWGWTDADSPKVVPVGQFKSNRRPSPVKPTRGALLVTCTVPRQSYWMYSIVVAGQWLDYFRDQCRFVSALPPKIQQELTVRLHPEDYEWSQAQRWKAEFKDINVDSGGGRLETLMRSSRIMIATYNATTFLESFVMNVPTIIYWNERHWELRDSAVESFNALEVAGVFHRSPELAARHLVSIWDDINGWWESRSVRDAVNAFKSKYCSDDVDAVEKISTVLTSMTRSIGTSSLR